MLIFVIALNLHFLRSLGWVVRSDPKEGNWESGRGQSTGAADGASRW